MLVLLDDHGTPTTSTVAPWEHPDLIAILTTEYVDDYVITAGDTVIQSAIRVGRESAARQFGAQGAVYTARLDGDVCDFCESLDGLQVAVPSPEYSQFSPLQHRKCRCCWVYVLVGEDGFVPDDDPYARIRDLEGGPGPALVGSAHLNLDLQALFAADVQRARAEILERKAEREANALRREAEKQARAARKVGQPA